MEIANRLMMVSLAAALAPGAFADTNVNERQQAAPDGVVLVDNATGKLKISGWDKAEVALSGRLGAGAEGVTLERHGKRVRLDYDLTHGSQADADLELSVPAGSTLEISGFDVQTSVDGVRGTLRVETVNGPIKVTAVGGTLELQTVNGAIEVSGTTERVQAEAVNGPVTLTGVSGNVQASTVNGPLIVEGGALTRAELQTVSGPLRVQAALADGALVEAQSVSGSIEFVLPADVSANFHLTTFSGTIVNELSQDAAGTSRLQRHKELTFTTGGGSASVDVETHSGTVRLRRR